MMRITTNDISVVGYNDFIAVDLREDVVLQYIAWVPIGKKASVKQHQTVHEWADEVNVVGH